MKKGIFYFLFLCISFSSCSLAVKRANRLYNELLQNKPLYDAVIVPGVPLKNGMWDSVMKARVLWSVYLYQNHYTRNIIYSGAAVYTPFYEAVVMGLYAQKLGVPAGNIFYDTLAMHSTENVYYSYLLAKQNKFKTIALASDPFQSALLQSFTRKRFSSPIAHVPVNFDIIRTMEGTGPYIDSMKAYKNGFTSILETESFFKRLKGTLGREIYYGPDKKLGKL